MNLTAAAQSAFSVDLKLIENERQGILTLL